MIDYLGDHVAVVVVAERARQLLVVHGRLVLALAPQLRDDLGTIEFELAVVAHPVDDLDVVLVGEQLEQELPQLDLAVVAWQPTANTWVRET